MKKNKYIYILVLFLVIPVIKVSALRKATPEEYKEFLSKFLEEKYYLNKDGDNKSCFVDKVDAECKGITVSSTGKTYDLDTYVAGVLNAEPGSTIEGNEELAKAQAIIIRSYTVAHTNNCTKSIGSSSNEQNFIDNSGSVNSEKYKKYATDTSGLVMADSNGVIEATYSLARASDCIPISGGKCKFKRCTKYADSISSCSGKVTEFEVPSDLITYTSNDIHYGGIEPYIAAYISKKENYTYDQILKAFYGDDIKIAKLNGSTGKSNSTNSSSSETTSCNDDTGDMSTVDGITFPVKNYDNIHESMSISVLQNNEYFANSGSNISQCPWYAKARAIEIINTSTLSSELKAKATAVLKQTFGNGIDWYGGINSTLGSYFAYSSDINKPMAGSIIAWSGGNGHNYGHVGIIEKVNSDGTVVLSDGWNGGGANADDTWSNVRVETVTMTIDQLRHLSGYHNFEGYTYLFSYRK